MGLLLVSNVINQGAVLVAAFFLIRGIVILIRGKTAVGGHRLVGPEARKVGLTFFFQFPVALVPWGILYALFDLGGGRSSMEEGMAKDLLHNFLMSAIFLVVVFAAYFWARGYAARHGEA